MKSVRIGVIGMGLMGTSHARQVLAGKARGLKLTAVADRNAGKREGLPGVAAFASDTELFRSGLVDAVVIATPHYHHTESGIAALKAGLHVLMEKPISVHGRDCERLIAAHRGKDQVFAAVLNQRTDPVYRKLRQLVQSGALGEIRRVNWTITNWFRTAAYYRSSRWRATWAGEGGGVLLNQCPHNLDLFQWIFGMPRRVHGFCQFGRYHDIEVEDDVTAYFEMDGGAHATFIASTGEAPGTNRLEVAAENGRVVLEHGQLTFLKNKVPMSRFSQSSPDGFAMPPHVEKKIMVRGAASQHLGILKNFADAILRGTPLIAPASEGIRSVELANAISYSSWTRKAVDLPLSSTLYARALARKVRESVR